MPHNTAIQIDKRISFSALGTGITSIVLATSLIAGVSARVEQLEHTANNLEVEIQAARATSITMARMEERLESMQKTLQELRLEVRHIYREGTKPTVTYSSHPIASQQSGSSTVTGKQKE